MMGKDTQQISEGEGGVTIRVVRPEATSYGRRPLDKTTKGIETLQKERAARGFGKVFN